MKKSLYNKTLFLFLLPVFFVFHGYTENFGLITIWDCLLLVAGYCIAAGIIYALLFFVYKDPAKAALLATLLLSFYFFFGALHDFLKTHTASLHKYSFLLPAFLVVATALAIYLRKTKKDLSRIVFFLNILVFVYLFTDAAVVCLKIFRPDTGNLSVYGFEKNEEYIPCSNCPKPDIYFLVFDEYNSSVNLSRTFNYNNSDLDSFLLQQGFRVQPHSFSNYNFTSFSIASILNMSYLTGIRNKESISPADYENSQKLIKNNAVVNILAHDGYTIVNYSIFDLAGNPSPVEVSLLPVKTKLITEQTFFATAMRDIGWQLNSGRLHLSWLTGISIYNNLDNNNRVLKLLTDESSSISSRPRFVYAHFEMPHWPFYFDKNRKLRNQADLLTGFTGMHSKEYTEYLTYTNDKLKEIVLAIQKNAKQQAVIIIMGDHGYRAAIDNTDNRHFFENLNAVYLPGQDYRLLQDTISGVNQFRVIFNTVFKQHLPLLKDSAFFLKDEIR